MNFEFQCDYFLVDDVEMYELDESNQPIGENLITNGGFETGFAEISLPDGISTVTIGTDTPEIAKLTWEPLSNTSQKINIYRKFGDEYVKIAVLPGSSTCFDVTGLETDVENAMAISVTATNHIESELYDFTVTPVSYPLIIDDVKLYRGNATLTELSRGPMGMSVSIKNNNMGDNFTAELVAALYKDNALVQIWTSEPMTIPQTASSEAAESISKMINIPRMEDGDYHLEVFLWDNYETMKVLKNMISLSEVGE